MVIGGQALCLLLWLVVMPVAYATLDTARVRRRERLGRPVVNGVAKPGWGRSGAPG